MRLVGLISGGKDSVFNMLQCVAAGHEMVAVANVEPAASEELDSYMYQSVGQEAVTLVAGALCLPIFRQKSKGKAICKSKIYDVTENDEVEDLYVLLSKVKKSISIDGVSVGAIASDYQRTRVENVCSRLGLVCFAYLWQRNQTELLQEMIDAELDAIIIKVATIGLEPNHHLGMHLYDIQAHLVDLNKKYGVNVCGEGGEYETLTLDCPLFHRSINITESENKIWSNDAFAPVGFLIVKNASLSLKQWGNVDSGLIIQEKIKLVQSLVKNPYFYVQDCVDELSQTIFPEKHYVRQEDLPFPFESENENENESQCANESKQDLGTELPEYWKSESCKKLHTNTRSPVKQSSSSLDTAVFTLNYSSGWCCIGNVTAPDLNEALICLQRHLDRMGYDFSDVVFINLFVKNMSGFVDLNKIYSEFIPEISPPARACVGTLLPPEIDVILVVVAHKVVSKTKRALKPSKSERETMHVQSISHWAPASIGPYSQCIKIGGIYYLAGQIPLVPGTMEILNKPIYHQCRLALRHILRVIQAMNENLNYSNVLQALCYVVSKQIAADMVALWPYITQINYTPVAAVVVCDLPKKAQLEWEVLAGDFGNPEVSTITDIIEDFHLEINRCFYLESNVSSMVCKVSFMKKSLSKISGKSLKSLKFVTSNGLINVLKTSIHFLKKDLTGSPLCMLKIFYKASDTPVATIVNDLARSSLDFKVISTAIPVVECEEPDIILTITGICH